MIVVIAGRRIDAPGANPPRFPLARRTVVRGRIFAALRSLGATTTVSSAACGADLLALDAARALGLRRRIILPYRAEWFLADSVTDRPGRWKSLFESLIAEARASGDLVELDLPRSSDDSYRAANDRILTEAEQLAQDVRTGGDGLSDKPGNTLGDSLGGLIIWEGAPRGPDDISAHIKRRLEQAGARVEQALTL